MKCAKDYMNNPRTIKHSSNLDEVLRKFIDEKKSRLLVNNDEKITGLISEKDLGLFLLTEQNEEKLENIPLTKIMKNLISVDGATGLPVCAEIMLRNGIGSLGVTSDDQITGIITKTDLVRYFTKTHPGEKSVGEYMSPYYSWQYLDSSLHKVVQKMIDEKIARVIIRDHEETPVGIVTFKDLFKLSLSLGRQDNVLDNSDPLISIIFSRKGFLSESGFGGTTKIGEVMSRDIDTVNYDDDLAKAGKLLLDNNINGAGVLSGHGNLIGIISKTDIVKALAFAK